MSELQEFIKPELLVLVPVLYILGVGIKKSGIADKLIPAVLGATGIVLACLYVFGTNGIGVMSVFTAITQGILCAGATVYANQLIKQSSKDKQC